ncbi:hypothetical protein CDAR_597281 [Caerostris darwini]|uniref:Uncharacterized protein n=1 Tax=Caerostris darwini TaxID=1538125 RepID=A0AAV4U2J1_9ARAC|nr:hypothetical protein CDAR_597281 [Caerostris darwini]
MDTCHLGGPYPLPQIGFPGPYAPPSSFRESQAGADVSPDLHSPSSDPMHAHWYKDTLRREAICCGRKAALLIKTNYFNQCLSSRRELQCQEMSFRPYGA